MLARAARVGAMTRPAAARFLSGYEQPPLNQGPGGKSGVVPSDEDQATGRERDEIMARKQGIEMFNRQPVKMQKGQGTFANPVMVPSEEHSRAVGMIPKGQDGPIWFELSDAGVHFVPELNLHFKLYNPHKSHGGSGKH
jgi:cytochrome c oxidase subunit 5b